MLAGCQPSEQSMMPLKKGNRWSYQVNLDFASRVSTIEVKGEAPVGGMAGFQLNSDMGRSLLAWRENRLYAEELGMTKFDPAIPIYARTRDRIKVLWKGSVTENGRRIPATATLESVDAKESIGPREYPAVMTTLSIKASGHAEEILTWYANGIGVLRQEQRQDGRLRRKLVYLSGP